VEYHPEKAAENRICWGYYGNKEEVDQLLSYLNTKGIREHNLYKRITQDYHHIVNEMNRHNLEILQQSQPMRRSERIKGVEEKREKKSFLSYINKHAG